ncbi:MAG: hypothetical protein DRN05_01050 [Thermoplasmata archaeon]|nr:MAG: hypothetical protein DRN05_01050 [Thermoplasmata archaeon]
MGKWIMYMQEYMQADGMRSKTLMTILILISFLLSINYFILPYHKNCYASTPPTLYVGEGETYTRIQDAIDNATDGYRIVVYNGTYYENLIIDKQLDIFGEDRAVTIIDGNGNGDVITISAENVNISHFTIRNSGSNPNNTVVMINSSSSIITDNIILNGQNGISIQNCGSHLIYDNIIKNNQGHGILLNNSDQNTITYNTIDNNHNGIYLHISDDNTIENNVVQNNTANGVFLNRTCDNNGISSNMFSYNGNGVYLNDYCDYNTISNNQIQNSDSNGIILENSSWNIINNNIVHSNNNYGIMIVGSNNTIQNNLVSYNKKHGMYFTADDNNTISSNTINNNSYDGMRLYNSTYDYIYNNEIYGNQLHGVYMDFFTLNNYVYNNFFHDNADNACDKSINRNIWNTSKTLGTNIVDGPYLGGNYWDDYTGSDNNNDGLGDTPYTIYAGNQDQHPLLDIISPEINNIIVTPSKQKTGGHINISATITDNVEIKTVHLLITYPNDQTINLSITQNKTGNTYYCNKTYTSVGTYSIYIAASDTGNNWKNSSYENFEITEGTPPTIVDNSDKTGSPSGKYTFNVTVTDDMDNAKNLTVKVYWTHGKLSGNHLLINTNKNFFEWTITLDSTTDNLRYYLYANDSWGNTAITEQKNITIIDKEPPHITINKHQLYTNISPNTYIISVTITDNTEVTNVYIEYWYDNSSTHTTANMDKTGENLYEKNIIPEKKVERIYCIIYANDTSGNQNNTMNPIADANGPYTGYVTTKITFNGSKSFDLDGTITKYAWDFGDGNTATGKHVNHTYSTSGNYTVKLTVIDNNERTNTDITYILIHPLLQTKTSYNTLNWIKKEYNITLNKLFYSYDSDGDGIVDTFFDPNNKLTAVHTGHINLSGNISFLISIDDTQIPELIWNSTTDKITPVKYKTGDIYKTIVNEKNNTATSYIKVDKTKWIYLETTDLYEQADITIKKANKTIPADRIWRKNGKIYLLDDAETQYQIIYQNIQTTTLQQPTFDPIDGGSINKDKTTITITYNTSVTILDAAFGNKMIDLNSITTADNKTFTYTPPSNLKKGVYEFYILVKDKNGDTLESTVHYHYTPYVHAGENILTHPLVGISILAATAAGIILTIHKAKRTGFTHFVYLKNKKLIPFFKTIILGPVSINIDDNRIAKAEFYIDGKLKETITTPPYFWQWNEKAFLKHTLETRVYDQQGNSISTGEMTFYIFNPSKKMFRQAASQ